MFGQLLMQIWACTHVARPRKLGVHVLPTREGEANLEQGQRHIQTNSTYPDKDNQREVTKFDTFHEFSQGKEHFCRPEPVGNSRLKPIFHGLQKTLKDHISEREQNIKEFKSNILINPSDFQKYGESEFVKNIFDLMNLIDKEGEEAKLNIQDAIDVRDYLTLTMAFINVLKASNLINVSSKEINSVKKHEELTDAYMFKNNKYKTSLIYGTKIVLVDSITYHHILLYIKFLRPLLILDGHRSLKDKYVFIASSKDISKEPGPMLHSLITTKMSRCFDKAGVFDSKVES